MMSSRGMGAINPNKMPGPKRKQRRDDTSFYEYAEGGEVKSKVNEAGNYTKPGDWCRPVVGPQSATACEEVQGRWRRV